MVIFNQKNGIFQIEILCTIHYDNSFCIHFWCILMHSDAYWSILLWLNERKTTSLQAIVLFYLVIRSRIPENVHFCIKRCQFWLFFCWLFDCFILILSNTGGIHLDLIVITVGLLRVPFRYSTRARAAHKAKFDLKSS